MRTIFHREANKAVAGSGPNAASFETWEPLAEALDMLTPEKRRDAVYADWLLQLHSPSHQALLQRMLHKFYQLAMPAAAARDRARSRHPRRQPKS